MIKLSEEFQRQQQGDNSMLYKPNPRDRGEEEQSEAEHVDKYGFAKWMITLITICLFFIVETVIITNAEIEKKRVEYRAN